MNPWLTAEDIMDELRCSRSKAYAEVVMGSRSSRSSTSTSSNGSSAAPRAPAFDAEAVAEAAVNGRAEAVAEQAVSARAEAAATLRGQVDALRLFAEVNGLEQLASDLEQLGWISDSDAQNRVRRLYAVYSGAAALAKKLGTTEEGAVKLRLGLEIVVRVRALVALQEQGAAS